MHPNESYYSSQWTSFKTTVELRRTPYLVEVIFLLVCTCIYAGSFAFVKYRTTGQLHQIPQLVITASLLIFGSEICRDIAAKFLGLSSEFILWPLGTILVFVSSFLGNVFSVPGHAVIRGGTKGSRALVSAATPAYTFLLATILIFFSPLGHGFNPVALSMVLAYGCYEILPINPLKGKAIWDYSKLLWLLLFAPLYLMYLWLVLLA